MSVKPLCPGDVDITLPDFVIEAINFLITENYKGGEFNLNQKDIVSEIMKRNPEISREAIFEKKYLDFEKLYDDYGWKVSYNKPDYRESPYPEYFKFKPV